MSMTALFKFHWTMVLKKKFCQDLPKDIGANPCYIAHVNGHDNTSTGQ